jgi:arginase family enzyme
MDIRVLDLDGSLRQQPLLLERFHPFVHDLRSWGPRLRLACGFGAFRRWQSALAGAVGTTVDDSPALTFVGSGDFHHVTLSLLRRIQQPYNLLVLDNHPDWMRGLPFLHCGTWLYHAACLPQVQHIFHLGGDVDFDNSFRWLAPWKLLRSGKLHVLPGIRNFRGKRWAGVPHAPLRTDARTPFDGERLEQLLEPFRHELSRRPLYVSLDKDVMSPHEAAVNWDSGNLSLPEVEIAVVKFVEASNGNIAGMDVVGDWSPVHLKGIGRRLLHWTEHPVLDVWPLRASRQNQRTNLTLADLWNEWRAACGLAIAA